MEKAQVIISVVILFFAVPIGLLASYLTKYEKNIYKKYFPSVLWGLAILSAIFYTLNIQIALTLNFMFLVTLVWYLK